MSVNASAFLVNSVIFNGSTRSQIGPKSAISVNASMETPRPFSCQRGLKLSGGDPQEELRNHPPPPSKPPKKSCLNENSHLPRGHFWWPQRGGTAGVSRCGQVRRGQRQSWAPAANGDALGTPLPACAAAAPVPAQRGTGSTHTLLFAQFCFV